MNHQRDTYPLTTVAAMIGRSPVVLAERMRKCALTGVYFPLGFAMPPGDPKGEWIYVFPRKRVDAYMNGIDLSVPEDRLRTLFQQQ